MELVVKVGRDVSGADARDRDRTVAEGRILAELDHPNLARVYDLDFDHDRPFLVMEYVRGRNLRQVAEQQPFGPRQAASLIAKVARALAPAHARGVIHLDVKPDNIVIDEAGQPRLIDFGIARIQDAWAHDTAEADAIRGTLGYVAPEQARGEQTDGRSDVFALGATLYFLLVGRGPLAGLSVDDVLDRAQRCDFDRQALHSAGIPGALRRICLRAVANGSRGIASRENGKKNGEKLERGHAREALDGRPLRRDFRLQCALPGSTPDASGNVLIVTEGQRVAFRVEADLDCYLGVWHVDDRGNVTQLFPNKSEPNHLVRAGEARTVPRAGVRATVSHGAEYVHIAASTEWWAPVVGREMGPDVVFALADERTGGGETPRGFVSDQSPAVSEDIIPFHVRAKQQLPATQETR